MTRLHLLLTLALAAALLTGCAPKTYIKGPDFDKATPQRVAVMPFADTTGEETVTSVPFTAAVDALPLVGKKLSRGPSTMLRNRYIADLDRSNLDVIHPGIVDAVLVEHGLYDVKKLRAMPPRKLARLIGADLLVFGTVVDWDRIYYVVESKAIVALKVEFIDGATGKTVFEMQDSASHTAGLRGGPTGYASAAIAPLQGLSAKQFIILCNALTRKMTDPLVVAEDPKFKGASPPFIAAAMHDGEGRSMKPGDTLTVLMVGSPGGRGAFRLGPVGHVVPMSEYGPGRYRGQYVVQPGDSFTKAIVEVNLVRAGRKTAADLYHSPIDIGQ